MPPKNKKAKATKNPPAGKVSDDDPDDILLLNTLCEENEALKKREIDKEQRRAREVQQLQQQKDRDTAAKVAAAKKMVYCPVLGERLLEAAAGGQVELVKLRLAEPGCVVDWLGEGKAAQITPLWAAAQRGHREVVEALVGAGADAEWFGPEGLTSLHTAAQHNCIEVVAALLAAGVSVDQLSRGPEGGVLFALSMLEGGARLDVADLGGSTALQLACEFGHLKLVALLLRHGARVGFADNEGFAPLYFAAQEGWEAVCALLLDKGAEVDQLNVDGTTPLGIASKHGRDRVVALLLRHGARVDVPPDIEGDTPLSVARSEGHLGVVRLLEAAIAKARGRRPQGDNVNAHAAFDVNVGLAAEDGRPGERKPDLELGAFTALCL